ncbi:IS1380 family transposase [Polaromonas sp.]|uniref:IS1380 family transposase n=1 Tax=Polaromonas sp. TaxID=1869339 RepID=UPI002488494D|nr:IS1380 family transposase [Polaromonas sp.]MDI1341201.1 IS1380 family transposase [Polaromonas sp.]
MSNCTEEIGTSKIEFGQLGRRVVEGRFDGGSMTGDGGVMLLGTTDRKLGLMEAAARCIADPRSPLLIKHGVADMLRQRVYGLALGWEDLNDHGALRDDVAMQTAVGADREGASAPTLCRLEKWADRATAWRLHQVLVEQFIASFKTDPEELVLDFDATDNPLYGQQEGRFFHGYYDCYCYLPLYVFCGQQLLCAYLRPSRIDGAKHAGAILKLLVTRLRQKWPQVRIVFRGDSGFCRQRIINYCERAGVHYIVGLARNARLEQITEFLELSMKDDYQSSGVKQREVGEFMYAAQSWARERRVITRLECGAQGTNPRYVVTNLTGDAQALYDDLYCQRGEAENRIKEAQVGLFATRTSCQHLQGNQLRVLLAALGYVLIERLRALALQGTALACAQVDTLRIKLLKVAAVVTRNTRRIRLYLASNWPSADIFAHAMRQLRSP